MNTIHKLHLLAAHFQQQIINPAQLHKLQVKSLHLATGSLHCSISHVSTAFLMATALLQNTYQPISSQHFFSTWGAVSLVKKKKVTVTSRDKIYLQGQNRINILTPSFPNNRLDDDTNQVFNYKNVTNLKISIMTHSSIRCKVVFQTQDINITTATFCILFLIVRHLYIM